MFRDNEFIKLHSVLDGKARILKENAVRKKPNKAGSFSPEEENILWECCQLDTHLLLLHQLIQCGSFMIARSIKTCR